MSVMDERHAQRIDDKATARSARGGYNLKPSPINFSIARNELGDGVHAVTIGSRTLQFPAVAPATPGALYEQSKRAADFVAASLLLLALFPLLSAVAFAIYLEDGGSIFYYQTRVGKNGSHFRFYKFRSMVRNADAIKADLSEHNEASGPIFKMKKDPRITRIGRFIRRYSIDELPQLVNVLRGEMSLIGPRPHLPCEVALYAGHQWARLQVQPGLLCFREVFGRSEIDFDQWIELDLLYIRYRSLPTDLRILLRTVPAILGAEGAY
jgi:lipopolysaccharide/colanic/teichoic acid biosynthesis glycosyltransferase